MPSRYGSKTSSNQYLKSSMRWQDELGTSKCDEEIALSVIYLQQSFRRIAFCHLWVMYCFIIIGFVKSS